MCRIWKWKKTEPPEENTGSLDEMSGILAAFNSQPAPILGAWVFQILDTILWMVSETSLHLPVSSGTLGALAVATLILMGILFREDHLRTKGADSRHALEYLGPLLATYGSLAYAAYFLVQGIWNY
jgi:hypothetical protein